MLKFCKKITIITLLLTLTFFGLLVSSEYATASEGQYGGVLEVATTADPPGLDTMANTHIATREVGIHIFETLVAFDEQYDIVPMLAENWDISEDGEKYTFYLRDNVPFHNGDVMTANDVKASIERFLEISPQRDNLAVLEEMNIVDDLTIEMILEEPLGAFLAGLAQPASLLGIMPEDVVKENGEIVDARQVDPIGTGPYMLNEWVPGERIVLERFDDYKPFETKEQSGFAGHKKAYLDKVVLRPVEETGSREAGLQTGEYDFADFISDHNAPSLAEEEGLVIDELMPYTWPVIYINNSEHSVFNDVRLRRAVQAGLNHEEIMAVSTEGPARLDPGLYFKEQVWHSDVGEELYNQNDQEKAKELMEEAGYDNEEILIQTNTEYGYMYTAAMALERQLAGLGFNARIEVTDWSTQLDNRTDLSHWDLSFSSHSIRFDPIMNNHYFMPETTFIGYDNPDMVEALLNAMRAVEFEERYQYYEEAQKIFYEDVPMIKLYDMGIWQGYQEHVRNYEPWYMPYFVGVWVDK